MWEKDKANEAKTTAITINNSSDLQLKNGKTRNEATGDNNAQGVKSNVDKHICVTSDDKVSRSNMSKWSTSAKQTKSYEIENTF